MAPPPIASTSPRYCPRCLRPVAADARLCPDCGETPIPQGYCPTCEARWRLAVGEPCPKHDLPLEAGPPTPRSFGDGPVPRWVTVGRYNEPAMAVAPRIRLEAEGIPTFLDGHRFAHNTLEASAGGGVRLQVPEPLAQEARVVLAQSWAADIEGEEDLDDAWDDLAPAPGTRRKAWMRRAILAVLALPLVRVVYLYLIAQ